jgi:dolichyl-phosphate beta-glucosyltransferase
VSTPKAGLSIVIPAYQEERRIGATLDQLVAWSASERREVEIVVVDDGSSDRTSAVAAAPRAREVRVLRLAENRGKGAALRVGVAATRGELVLLTDADLSTPISELARLEAALAGADLALGSRAVAGSRIVVRQAAWRELAGKLFNRAIRLLGVRGFADTQCGFKLLWGDAARELFARLTVDRFAYDVELVWLARRLGYRVVEVGVEWRNAPDSRVQLWRDAPRMLVDVLRFRRRHRDLRRSSPRDET